MAALTQPLHAYLALSRASYRRQRAYGAANIAGLLTNGFFGVVRSFVFIALYRARPVAEGYDLMDALTYVWISQSLIMPVYMWGWQEIALTVRTGDVVTDLSRPLNYFGYWLSRDLGRALYHILFRMAPTILLGLLIFHIELPGGTGWLLFSVGLLLAIVVSFCMRFIVNLSAFWLSDIRGVNGMMMLTINLLSGFIVPVEFLPSWLRAAAELLPFASIIHVPVQLFLGRAAGLEALGLIGGQLAWAAVLGAGAAVTLRAAWRKLVIQGG